MDLIEKFEINLDLSNVESLYDYGSREWLKRPEEQGWNLHELVS